MPDRRDGGPAFPQPIAGDHDGGMYTSAEKDAANEGLSLRDYFAGQALVGLLAHHNGPAGDWYTAARDSYEAADAMLAAREVDDA